MNSPSDDERPRRIGRAEFPGYVAAHVDKIASADIRPVDGRLDFALMYIPAENVYYETVIQCAEEEDMLHYCLDRKVIPVSPNLLYAYLMTVAMGLHGLQIDAQAAEIRQNLQQLNGSFAEFLLPGTPSAPTFSTPTPSTTTPKNAWIASASSPRSAAPLPR